MSLFANLKLTTKLIAVLLLVSVVPLSLLGISSFVILRNVLLEQSQENSQRIVDGLVAYQGLYIKQVEALSSSITSNETINNALFKVDEQAVIDSFVELNTRANMGYALANYSGLPGVVSIDLFSRKGHHFHVGDTLEAAVVSAAEQRRLFDLATKDSLKSHWVGVVRNFGRRGLNKPVQIVVKAVRYYSAKEGKSVIVGLLVIALDDSVMRNFIDASANKLQLLQTDAAGNLVFHHQRELIGKPLSADLLALTHEKSPAKTIRLDNADYLINIINNVNDNGHSIVLLPIDFIEKTNRKLSQISALAILVCSGFVAVFALYFIRKVIKPIRDVSSGFEMMSKDENQDRESGADLGSGNEISQLILGYHQYLHSINSLREARQAAVAASEAKSTFLATMSHEIRTPMNGILGMLKLLGTTELTPRQADYRSKAEMATKALLGIINDILDFSKVEAGKLELDYAPFSLSSLLQELAVVLPANMGDKSLEVLIDLDPLIPDLIEGDALRLRQVLTNLMGNAIKFTAQGEVVLKITMVKQVQDQNGRGQVALEFVVQDSGIGIAADKLDYVFQGFSQAESSTTRRFGGTGLGLSISKKLIEMMGGELKVRSEQGKGSCFFFTISLTVAAGADVAKLAPIESIQRVLVVDDNETTRMIHRRIVEAIGWQCECVPSGEAALERLAELNGEPIDVVLLDQQMHGLDGWETLRKIREQHFPVRAPIVLMVSGTSQEFLSQQDPEDIERLDGYLVKPITSPVVYHKVLEAFVGAKSNPQPAEGSVLPLSGLKILLVEDNLLNQQIANELLTRNGAQVEVANGGIVGVQKALEASPPYQVILMDLQMPDIDGFEATRRILAEPKMQSIPIIAMTANALVSDKEACHAAGMVAHVGKPFNLDELISTILQHVAQEKPAVQQVNQELTPVNVSADQLDVALDVEAAIARIGGDSEFYKKVVHSFEREAALLMEQIQQSHVAGQLAETQRALHTLKGLAGTVGATGLATRAAMLDQQAKQMITTGITDTKSLEEPIIILNLLYQKTLQAFEGNV